MSTVRGWLFLSAFGATFWGSLIGLLVAALIDLRTGYFAGIVVGLVVYNFGLLVGGCCVNKSISDEYTVRF